AILLFREVTTMRGRSGFTSISPVFLLFRSDRTRDQPPFRAFACLTARRDKSNGRLNPTIRSPLRTARQNTRLIKEVRHINRNLIWGGNFSVLGTFTGFPTYCCNTLTFAAVGASV